MSNRGAWDHATAATVLYLQPSIVPRVTKVMGTDFGELRGGIDALRYALHLPAAFGGSVAPAGHIRATHATSLVTALNEALAAAPIPPFAYSGIPAPAVGSAIQAEHIRQLREALR